MHCETPAQRSARRSFLLPFLAMPAQDNKGAGNGELAQRPGVGVGGCVGVARHFRRANERSGSIWELVAFAAECQRISSLGWSRGGARRPGPSCNHFHSRCREVGAMLRDTGGRRTWSQRGWAGASGGEHADPASHPAPSCPDVSWDEGRNSGEGETRGNGPLSKRDYLKPEGTTFL